MNACMFQGFIVHGNPGSTDNCVLMQTECCFSSERVYKCQLGGQMLVEARHINLSLHFLEQVILALGESNRSHIPYRNSLLTTILRDSVGGNCMTIMVATLCLCIANIEVSYFFMFRNPWENLSFYDINFFLFFIQRWYDYLKCLHEQSAE